jgi:hypothetical protein
VRANENDMSVRDGGRQMVGSDIVKTRDGTNTIEKMDMRDDQEMGDPRGMAEEKTRLKKYSFS